MNLLASKSCKLHKNFKNIFSIRNIFKFFAISNDLSPENSVDLQQVLSTKVLTRTINHTLLPKKLSVDFHFLCLDIERMQFSIIFSHVYFSAGLFTLLLFEIYSRSTSVYSVVLKIETVMNS